MSNYRELLLGCGHARDKRIVPPGAPKEWQALSTLDRERDCNPDIICDLRALARGEQIYAPDKYGELQLISDSTFDEIHAYEVLEHLGYQGDEIGFFTEFREYHRLLKPGGYFCATCPAWNGYWTWSDPGHRRVITAGTLVFLSKKEYTRQLGFTAMSDYRALIGSMDFEIVRGVTKGETFEFILKAFK